MLGLVKRLGALALLLGLLVGFPALLLAAVGNPWPDGGLNELSLMSNSAVLGIVSLLGWFVWAQLLLCTLWEIPPALRHETEGASRLPIAVGGQQRFIRMLVHTVLAVGVTSTTLLGSHAATAEAAPAAPLRPVTHVAHQAPAANPETSPAASPVKAAPDTTQDHRADPPRIVTDKGDTLWGLAEKHLGDGFRWQEIADLNHGRAMSDGRTFNNPRSIEPGWELLLPADATNLPGDQTTETEHVVAPGETLTGITKETTDDPDNWQALYEANKDVIGSDPDLIYPGQVLVLPGAGAVDPATGTDRQPQREPGQRDHVPGKSTDGQGDDTGADSSTGVDDAAGQDQQQTPAEPATPTAPSQGSAQEAPASTEHVSTEADEAERRGRDHRTAGAAGQRRVPLGGSAGTGGRQPSSPVPSPPDRPHDRLDSRRAAGGGAGDRRERLGGPGGCRVPRPGTAARGRVVQGGGQPASPVGRRRAGR